MNKPAETDDQKWSPTEAIQFLMSRGHGAHAAAELLNTWIRTNAIRLECVTDGKVFVVKPNWFAAEVRIEAEADPDGRWHAAVREAKSTGWTRPDNFHLTAKEIEAQVEARAENESRPGGHPTEYDYDPIIAMAFHLVYDEGADPRARGFTTKVLDACAKAGIEAPSDRQLRSKIGRWFSRLDR